MTVQTINDARLMQEVAQVLLDHLSPDKVARFWASWQVGHGDYLDWRAEEFKHENVDTLYQAIIEFQNES